MFNESLRNRCDSCGKWNPCYELYTLPEELYPILDCDNEFEVCMACCKKYTVEDWKKRIVTLRKRRTKKEDAKQ